MADALFKTLMPYETKWCNTMGYFNPYIDGFTTHLTDKMPFFDKTCYNRYPRHNFVYDKLWIIKSQGLAGGRLEKLSGKEKKVQYPIFIKPRWGHLSASSKNCFKISSAEELSNYIDYPNMIWSEFIDAKEGMTDYVLLKGQIVHQLTYVYSDKQNGFSDDWKYISPKSTPPSIITEWVKQHMTEFTGIVNVQYRSDKIIEVGLRLARGGAYLVSTKNAALINNINGIFTKKEWDYNADMNFKPFYVFKCFTTVPIIYIFPQKLVDWFIRKKTTRTFYEYYFEPTGATGMVFFQFMDDDFDRGMQTKKRIEELFTNAQIMMYILIGLVVLCMVITKGQSHLVLAFAFIVLLLFLTRLLNPIVANYNLYKAQKQSIFGGGPTNDIEAEIETFDGGSAPSPPRPSGRV
jgi:hypothetical protein